MKKMNLPFAEFPVRRQYLGLQSCTVLKNCLYTCTITSANALVLAEGASLCVNVSSDGSRVYVELS